jgi:ATP-binding cassette subfamily C protein
MAVSAELETGWSYSRWVAAKLRGALASGKPAGGGQITQAASGEGEGADPSPGGLAEWRAVARRYLIVVGLFSVVVNLLMLTIPIYLFQLSDRVLTSRSFDTLIMLSVLALAFLVVMSVLDVLRRQVLGTVALKLETILGGLILAGVVTHGRREDQGTGQALRQLHQVRGFISGPVMLMLFDAPMAPLYFAAVFLIHWDLGIIAVASGFALLATAILNQKVTAAALKEAGQHAAKADAQAEALARNSQVINAMGMLNQGIWQWGRSQARALTLQSSAQKRNFWVSGLSKFLRLFTQVAMLGWGAYLALHGEITGGTMIAASIIAGRGLQPIEGMIEGWKNLVQARASYAAVCQLAQQIENDTPRLKLPKPQGHVIADKVLYIPPGSKEPVLNGLGFELLPGESLAIVGPSGAGKSTLAKILVGCLAPTAGRVRLDGTELKHWDRRQFGEFTGYLPQEVELFPGTIKENVCRMRNDLDDEAIYEAASLTCVHDMITRLPNGYETVIDGSGAPLSGGQKQRIALARAFFGNPALVVLDEPNSNLDALGEQALADTVRRAKEKRITFVAVTQRPALLNCVDKVLILRGGRIEAFGPPQEVLHRVIRASEPQRPSAEALLAAPPAGPQTQGA